MKVKKIILDVLINVILRLFSKKQKCGCDKKEDNKK